MVAATFMRILALDTSGERLSACRYEDGRARALSLAASARQDLLLDRALAHLYPEGAMRLDAIAVGVGPGRFTGIRIGVAFAVVLGRTLGVPVAGFRGLESLAYQASWARGAKFPFTAHPVLPAVRDEVYWGAYRVEAPGKVRAMGADGWGPRSEIPSLPGRRLAGPSALASRSSRPKGRGEVLRAETLARRAAALLAAGAPLPAAAPYYLKPGSYEKKA